MSNNRIEKFQNAIKSANVPVLVLDNNWYKLQAKTGSNREIKSLEEELKGLIKRQGKLTNEINSIKKIKKNLQAEIVSNMDDGTKDRDNAASDKKLDDNKRLINECNEKIDAYQDEMIDLPHQIDSVNKELMLKTMELCYERIKENTDDIEEIADWIKQIRIELKRKVIKKQEKEIENIDFYTFMHNIFGQDAMNIFDMKYEPTLRVPEKKTEEKSNK